MITLDDLGYTNFFEDYRQKNNLHNFEVGRVISEHKERYIVKTSVGEFEGEIIGSMRFSAQSRNDFPAVGDWVSVSQYDVDKVIIHNILSRKNVIERQAVGKFGEKQIIASNIDYAFIVQAADRDFNINRIERYLTICNTSNILPIIVINKIDLIDDSELKSINEAVEKRIKQIPVFFISNQTKKGYEDLVNILIKGKTYCLLGSSGVGKSTLINNLIGENVMQTNSISASSKKGRHVTTHRQLFVLENGGLIIDNPGMKEIGIADVKNGLEITFNKIAELSDNCKYKNCKHVNEAGCAIIKAVENNIIDRASYENFLKLEKEKHHFEMDYKERRNKDKKFGKMIKQYKKDVKKNK
ncbi:MAG: ribosome small subunit-dependent GTPase A [Bacteroidales bacterium]|nr:ribosome small subunit-dependent GTPase A [Bacteroidales bacterium]